MNATPENMDGPEIPGLGDPGNCSPVGSDTAGRVAAQRISRRTGKPVRKYTRSGKFSKNPPENFALVGEENDSHRAEENSSAISDADLLLYQKCFGESIECGLKAIGEIAAAHIHARLRKIGTDDATCREIAAKVELPEATGKALNSQATILAKKYEIFARFGVEAAFAIGLATWGISIASAIHSVKELEQKVVAIEKEADPDAIKKA